MSPVLKVDQIAMRYVMRVTRCEALKESPYSIVSHSSLTDFSTL